MNTPTPSVRQVAGQIGIRLATKRDVETYIWIVTAAEEASKGTYIAVKTPEAVEREIRYSFVFIVTEDEAEVGVLSFRHPQKGEAYISEVAIHPDYWGNGIGTQAFDMLMACLIHEGCRKFGLHTDPLNENALKIYLGYGFEKRGLANNWHGSGKQRRYLALDLALDI